jgi:hypothetical protein
MHGRTTIIRVDGSAKHEEHTSMPGLEFWQKAVGGHIEMVPYWRKAHGEECVVFCNEEGKMNGLPVNTVATEMWKRASKNPVDDYLVGDIVMVTGDAEFMAAL